LKIGFFLWTSTYLDKTAMTDVAATTYHEAVTLKIKAMMSPVMIAPSGADRFFPTIREHRRSTAAHTATAIKAFSAPLTFKLPSAAISRNATMAAVTYPFGVFDHWLAVN
jgi:hypothetical protein